MSGAKNKVGALWKISLFHRREFLSCGWVGGSGGESSTAIPPPPPHNNRDGKSSIQTGRRKNIQK